MSNANVTDWKHLERLVMAVQARLDPGSDVRWNDKVVGRMSQVERQLDVTVRGKTGSASVFVAFDCKYLGQNVDVTEIGKSAALFKDVGALGVVVTTKGFSDGALNLAESEGIETCLLRAATEADWQGRVRSFQVKGVLQRVKFDGCEVEYSDGMRIEVDPEKEWVKDNAGTRGSLADGVRQFLAQHNDRWSDGVLPAIRLTDPLVHETGHGPRTVAALHLRAHREQLAIAHATFNCTEDWVFVKLRPGDGSSEAILVEFQTLNRIAEADARVREAVKAVSCPTHGRKPGVIVTWRGTKQQEVRLDPLPCCIDLEHAVMGALEMVMRELFAGWKREDEGRFLVKIGEPLTALLMAKWTSQGPPGPA